MVEWNGIFRLFRFSAILGQPREVHLKSGKCVPFAPQPGISGIFGRMESAPRLQITVSGLRISDFVRIPVLPIE